MDYEKLKKELKRLIPEDYTNGLVEKHECKRQAMSFEYNFNPYKNGGDLLPDDFKMRNHDGTYSDFITGYRWFFETILRIDYNNLQDFLPAFFIYAFHKGNNWIACDDVVSYAEHELKEAHLPFPNHNVKYVFPIGKKQYKYLQENFHVDISRKWKSSRKRYVSITYNREYIEDEKELAKIIFNTVTSFSQDYIIEYWHFPESEFERGIRMHNNAMESFFREIVKSPNPFNNNEKNEPLNLMLYFGRWTGL